MSFPNRNFEGNYSTYVFGKSFCHYREQNIDCWTSRNILCEKKLNPFLCVEVWFVVETWNVYEGYNVSRPLLKTCRMETTSLRLKTRLLENIKIQILIIFIWINVNVCLLCAHHVMTSIILHTRRPNCQ